MSKKKTIEEINSLRPADCVLAAICFKETEKGKTIIECVCECWNLKKVTVSNFLRGHAKSCGCKKGELIANKKIKYSGNISEVYSAYMAMIRRCYNVADKYYPNYGGRGVRVCDEWLNDYMAFLTWSKNNGWRKGLEIDKDTVGDGLLYSPTTCRWVTKTENNFQRKDTRMIMYKGEKLSVSEISRRSGVNKSTLTYRLNSGWSEERLYLPTNKNAIAV